MKQRYGSQSRSLPPEVLSQMSSLQSQLLRAIDEPDQPGAPRAQFDNVYTPEYVNERINQLRHDRMLGGLFAMSGDRALAPVGQELLRSNPLDFEMEANQQKQVRDYQQWQADVAAQPQKASRFDRLYKAMGAVSDMAGMQRDANTPEYQNLPVGLARDLPKIAQNIDAANYLDDTFDPSNQSVLGEYQTVLKNVPSWLVSNKLEQVAADMLSEGAPAEKVAQIQKSALWWSEFKQLYELQNRHDLFGAALTTPEKIQWQQAMLITPSTDPGVVKQKLALLRKHARKIAEYAAKTYSPVYGEEKIMPSFEGLLDGPPVTPLQDSSGNWLGREESPPAIRGASSGHHPQYGSYVVEED